MRIGLFVGALELMRDIQERLYRISAAEQDGFDSYWLPQHFGADMLTVIAMAGMQTSRIEIGTAVVPTYPRHPVALAPAKPSPPKSPSTDASPSASAYPTAPQ